VIRSAGNKSGDRYVYIRAHTNLNSLREVKHNAKTRLASYIDHRRYRILCAALSLHMFHANIIIIYATISAPFRQCSGVFPHRSSASFDMTLLTNALLTTWTAPELP